jgi:hypothetical protein
MSNLKNSSMKTNKIELIIPLQSQMSFIIIMEDGTEYQTLEMSMPEYDDADNFTFADWQNYLKTDNYFKIN